LKYMRIYPIKNIIKNNAIPFTILSVLDNINYDLLNVDSFKS